MLVFQKLTVNENQTEANRLIENLTKNLPPEWIRDQAAETGSATVTKYYCFEFRPTSNLGDALLWLTFGEGGSLYVANIVPTRGGNLSVVEYNDILTRFASLLRTQGANITISKSEQTPEDWFGTSAARQLRAFSKLANRSILHHYDEERWKKFLFECHTNRTLTSADSRLLLQWLTEDERWPEDSASRLCSDLERARELLKSYDEFLAEAN